MSHFFSGYDSWKLATPPEYEDDYEVRLLDLNSWHAKHQKAIDDECDRRQAELDAWYAKATEDLEAEYAAEKDRLPCGCYGCRTMRYPCIKDHVR